MEDNGYPTIQNAYIPRPLNLPKMCVPATLCKKLSGVIMSSLSNLILSRVSLLFCCRLFLPSRAQGADMKC